MIMENIKEESPLQSEVTSEIAGGQQYGHNSNFSSNYNEGFAFDSYGVPNGPTVYAPYLSNIEVDGGYNPAVKGTSSGTGITIRTRQNPNQIVQETVKHGTAPKRIRFQKKFQVGSLQCNLPKDPTDSKIVPKEEATQVRYHVFELYKHHLSPRLPISNPRILVCPKLWFITQDDNKVDELKTSLSTSDEPTKSGESSTDSKVGDDSSCNEPAKVVSAGSACGLRVSSSRYMPKVLLAVGLVIVLVGVWSSFIM